MDLSKGDRELSSSTAPSLDSNRRTFLRSLAAGVAVGVPAIRVLASGTQASAKVIPNINPCSKTYVKYIGHYCTWGGGSTCPAGDAGECIGQYVIYSSITGAVCGRFTDNEGPCGTNTCGAASTAAPAVC
jgi:hypothetical protein